MVHIDASDAVPIWRQIEDEIRRMVALGKFSSGDAVPSVRDLAKELRVNPATVAKAYQHLSEAGLLEVRRGEGTFVADPPAPIRKQERRQALEAAARRYVGIAATLGATPQEALSEISSAFEELQTTSGRRHS